MAVPAWKRWLTDLFSGIFKRSGLLRRWVRVLHKMAFPIPPFERHYRVNQTKLLKCVHGTDLRDESLLHFNDLAREKRKSHPAGPLIWSWILPDVTGAGSGGHLTVFRFARYLLAQGHRVRIHINIQSFTPSEPELRKYIDEHYGDTTGMEIIPDTRVIADCDILFATGWETAYTAFNVTNTLFKGYLIQDYEPYFFPRGAEAVFAENSYQMNFFPLCSSPWLAGIMRNQYKTPGAEFFYGYDHELYRANDQITRDPNMVAVYIRPMTSRRGTDLVTGTLTRLKEVRPNTRIVTFGHNEPLPNADWASEQLGQLDDQKLAEVYNRAAIVFVVSLTNYSIIPIEAMACGAMIVDVHQPSTDSIFTSGEGIVLAEPFAQDIANTIGTHLDDPDKREKVVALAQPRLDQSNWPGILEHMEASIVQEFFR